MTVSHIEIVDHGKTINAYEDAPRGRVLAVLTRPRPYTDAGYEITVPRTGKSTTRRIFGFAMSTLRRMAHTEYLEINGESK